MKRTDHTPFSASLQPDCTDCGKPFHRCECLEYFEAGGFRVDSLSSAPKTLLAPRSLAVELVSFCLEIENRSLTGVVRRCQRPGLPMWVEVCFVDCVPLIDLFPASSALSRAELEENERLFYNRDFAVAVDSMPFLFEYFGESYT